MWCGRNERVIRKSSGVSIEKIALWKAIESVEKTSLFLV